VRGMSLRRAEAPRPAKGKGSNVRRGGTGSTGCRDIPSGVSEEYGECTADRFENLSLHLFGLIVAPLVLLRAKRSNLASPNAPYMLFGHSPCRSSVGG